MKGLLALSVVVVVAVLALWLSADSSSEPQGVARVPAEQTQGSVTGGAPDAVVSGRSVASATLTANASREQTRETAPATSPPTSTRTIRGRVNDSIGVPVSAARIEVRREPAIVTVTNRAGEFEIAVPGGDRVLVTASCPGYSQCARELDGDATEVELTLEPLGCVRGNAVDAITGAPVVSFSLLLYDDQGRCRAMDVENRDGKFALERVRPGRYRLVARTGRERIEEGVHFEIGEEHLACEGIVLRFAGNTVIRGTVLTLGGEPAQAMPVLLMRDVDHRLTELATDVTDAEGRFGFWRLDAADYQLIVGDGERVRIVTDRIELRQGEVIERSYVVPDLPELEITVRDTKGRPIAMTTVEVIRHSHALAVDTDAMGQAVVKNILPGEVEVTVLFHHRPGERESKSQVVINATGTTTLAIVVE